MGIWEDVCSAGTAVTGLAPESDVFRFATMLRFFLEVSRRVQKEPRSPRAVRSSQLSAFSLYPPERTQPEPGKRSCEAHREQQPPRSSRVAGLILPVLAHARDGPDRGHRQESESGHFQPELMQHPTERMGGLAHPGQYGPARPAALDRVDNRLEGRTDGQRNFFHHLTIDH